MIAGLRGHLIDFDAETSSAILDVQGVRYEVRIPGFTVDWVASQLSARLEGDHGAEVTFHTYYHVSERNPQPLLVGFQHKQERDFFRRFIEVPDVGPVKAVKALTRPVAEIARWIEAGDTKALEQLPGIGRRLSQTIVAQLSGKLTQAALLRTEEGAAPAPAAPDLREDAVEALVALQYARREAERAVEQALDDTPDLGSLEALLRAILEQQSPPSGSSEAAS